jgi:hypothetical protein
MSWNHRVVRFKAQDVVDGEVVDEDLAVCEVYYDDDGKPAHFDPTPFVRGDTIDNIKHVLALMAECLERPVIDQDEFDEKNPEGSLDVPGLVRLGDDEPAPA